MALTRVSRHIIDEPLELQNINATGIGTFASLRVTGDLQVDGTTTTLDTVVTSVDRLEVGANNSTVGVAITQSGTGDIFNLYDGSNKEFSVTDGGTVKISQSMAFQQSDRATTAGLLGRGSLLIAGTQQTDFAIRSAPHDSNLILGVGVTERLRITSGGVVGINTDVSNNPSGSKLVVGGRIQSNAGGYWFAGANGAEDGWHVQDSGGNLLVVESGVAERLRITSDGKVRVPDGGKFVAGDGDDLQIYHDGHSKITNGAGHLYIDQDAEDGNIYVRSDDGSSGLTNYILCNGSTGAVRIHHYGAQKLETTSTGIQVTGQIDIGTTSIYGTGDISMGDSDKLRLGAGDDLRIYHNGSHSYIDETGDGNLYIRNGTKNSIFARTDGEVILYHDNNNRLETTNTGASVTGNLNISGHTYLNDNRELVIGAGNDLKLYHNATDSYIDNATGDFYIRANGDDMILRAADNISIMPGNGENGINVYGDGPVDLYYDNYHKFQTTATGAKVLGSLEVTQEYPSIRPTLDLNFAATKSLDRRITFTRDSIGTYVDENGIVKYASNNVPRFDHNPDTRESLGLLIEESRTNYVDNSNDVSQWNRIINNATIESNTTDTLSPDGTNTSTKITGGSNSGISRDGILSVSASTTYIASVFAKKGTADSFKLEFGTGANQFQATFNLTTKAFSGTSTGGWFTSISTSYVDYPNGWVRVILTGTTGGAVSGSPNFAVYGISSGYVYFWGAQAEVGPFVTSLIPTHGSTVTRAADFATIKGTNFTDFYNQNEGTLFGEFTIKDIANTSAAIANINQEPGSSYANSIMFVEIGTANGYFGRTYKNSGGLGLSNSSSVLNSLHPSTTPQTVSFGYTTATGGTLAAYWNGNSVNSSSDLSKVPTTLTNMRIGRGWGGTDTINAHIRKLSYYPKRLPDAQLQGLTQQ
jgi:hypothetical protein